MHNGTLYYAKADNYVPSNFPIETHTHKKNSSQTVLIGEILIKKMLLKVCKYKQNLIFPVTWWILNNKMY